MKFIKKLNLIRQFNKQRDKQLEQGFFDGRFVQRSEESKKVYKRKEKHPKKKD